MPTIANVRDALPKANILGYGPSGAGKTTFIKSIVRACLREDEKAKAYIFNFEANNLYPLADFEKPEAIEYDDYTKYDQVLNKIVKLKNSCPYALVVVDGGGTFHRIVMDHILLLGKRELPQIQDYGLAQERMIQRVKDLLSLPCHVYFTFHEQVDKDETVGKITGRVLVPGKQLPDLLPPLFNMFLHFEMSASKGGEPKRQVRCAPDGTYSAGDKFGALAISEEPDFAKMWDKIINKIKANQGQASPATQPKGE